MARKVARRQKGPGRLRRRVLALAILGFLAVSAWLLWPFWRLSARFGERPLQAPSRLYGRPALVEAGVPLGPDALAGELAALGFRASPSGRLAPGEYRRQGDRLQALLRPHPTPEGLAAGGMLEVRFSGRRVAALRWRGREVGRAVLEPPLLTSFYGPRMLERRPVDPDEVPEDLIHAVLAAEDDNFFRHPGLSPSGILRAAWVNLRQAGIRQGGSTLTQQLVKNLYLSHDRTVARKLREAVLAVLLELRYSKRAILRAYLNEIYWGRSGPVNLMGVGAAAWAYFGKEASQLTLPESALLAGMIRAPGDYSPRTHPERARERRDRVLRRMVELGWLEEARMERALAEPLRLRPQPLPVRRAPYFADAVALEAEERFDLGELADRGFALLATLDPGDQDEAEAAVAWGLEALAEGWEKGRRGSGPLQAALVSLDPRSGEVLAYVGGRDYAASQFDRAGRAHRQAGSAFKPVVYAAAFRSGRISPATLVEDAPLTVNLPTQTWTPANYGGEFQGWVTVRTALEDSLNTATARLALQVGLPKIVALARDMGIRGTLRPVPSLALGSFEVTPVELAAVYATLASGGVPPPVHRLRAVLDGTGKPVDGRPLPEPEPALSPQVAYLVTSVLQGVLERGTGASARVQGIADPLAGKTGTTNDRRDSWFVGYSPDRVTLVWVGYDDNSPTRLSGARAALPIWARFAYGVRPPGGYPGFPQPPGIATAVVDPETGELATDRCPEILTEAFLEGQVPRQVCHLHGGWLAVPVEQPEGLEGEGAHPFRRWLRKVFGHGDEGGP